MLEFEKNGRFDQFLLSLVDAGLISLKTDDRLIIIDKKKFLEFGFGLYLLWVHIHKRQKIPFLYFTEIKAGHTLFLVLPSAENPYFIAPRDHGKGKFFLDRIEKGFFTNPGNCFFCDLHNSLLANISYFKNTDAFRPFLTTDRLGKLTKNFPKIKKGQCSSCSTAHFNWIKEKILQDDNYGLMLGGYPAVLETPFNIFEILFNEPIELSELHRETGSLFDFFLCVYLAHKFESGTYFANSKIKKPFCSHEIDVGVIIEKKSKCLLIVETASFYHSLSSLKNKLLNYSALKRGDYDKFMYIYLTLSQGISARISPDRIEPIAEDHNDLGTFASIFTNNEDLELLSLPPIYKDLDANIKNDWWDKGYLKLSYKYLIGKLEDLTNNLLV